MKQDDLAGIVELLEDQGKQLKQLRRWTESAVSDLLKSVVPPIQHSLNDLGQKSESHSKALHQSLVDISGIVETASNSLQGLQAQAVKSEAMMVKRSDSLNVLVQSSANINIEHVQNVSQNLRESIALAADRVNQDVTRVRTDLADVIATSQLAAIQKIMDIQMEERLARVEIVGRRIMVAIVSTAMLSVGGLIALFWQLH